MGCFAIQIIVGIGFSDRCLGMWGAIAFCGNVGGRSLFGDVGGDRFLWGCGGRSLLGMWEGDRCLGM
ncbi:MAG: hypothetical protein IM549_19095 [Pseudanabaena sp. M53BS1SP1A06MG]|nr:hypothetical protein [Pseudanabaena sp. M53BS1SP1A06MG]